jgi:hypothetical protein
VVNERGGNGQLSLRKYQEVVSLLHDSDGIDCNTYLGCTNIFSVGRTGHALISISSVGLYQTVHQEDHPCIDPLQSCARGTCMLSESIRT